MVIQLIHIHESQLLNFQELCKSVEVMLKFGTVQTYTTQKSVNTIKKGFFLFQRASTPLSENLKIFLPPTFQKSEGREEILELLLGPQEMCTNIWVVFESVQRKETQNLIVAISDPPFPYSGSAEFQFMHENLHS